jgi:dipeptidase E
MKNLFLTSSASFVIEDIVTRIPEFKPGMKLAFISTAAEVEKGSLFWLEADKNMLAKVGFKVYSFSFTSKSSEQVKEALEPMDVFFFSGGNTYFLLQEIQRSKCASYINERVEQGTTYIGSSAGSIVACPSLHLVGSADDISLAPKLVGMQGMELTDVVVYPHWANEYFKESFIPSLKAGYVKGSKVILLTDDQYLWVHDDWYQILSV